MIDGLTVILLIVMIMVMILLSVLIKQTEFYNSRHVFNMEAIIHGVNELISKHNISAMENKIPHIVGYDIKTKELYIEIDHDIKLSVDNINHEDKQSNRDEFKDMCNEVSNAIMKDDMDMAKYLIKNSEYADYVNDFNTVIIAHYSGSYFYMQRYDNCRSNIEFSDNMIRTVDAINTILNTKEEI